MKSYILSATLALVLGSSSFAYAVGTGGVPTYPGLVPGPNSVATGGDILAGSAAPWTAADDPATDVHEGQKTDYRLSCPHILDEPTVDACRKLYEPHK